MVGFKSTCPKWHFGHIGHGGEKTIKRIFVTKILVKKGWDFLVVEIDL
jgi:hypothetical protein